MLKNMLSAGLSMGFMSSLVNIGSLTLQTAINKLGKDITPLVSSSLEMLGKIVIAFTLVPMLHKAKEMP